MEANNWMNTDSFNDPSWYYGIPLVQSFCQGVIVSTEWVLTHADCEGFHKHNWNTWKTH